MVRKTRAVAPVRPEAETDGAVVPLEPRQRLSGAARVETILDAAAAAFAGQGFALTTRALAARLGVTQALLYRYFPSKQAIVEGVLARAARGRWQEAWTGLLGDRAIPLEARLTSFYGAYVGAMSPLRMRLFVRANLDGEGLAQRFASPLTERVLRPVVAELRHAAGLSDFAVRPLMRGERELAMALHGSLVFLAIRKHIYRMPMPDSLDEIIALQVRVYLPGALHELGRLHGASAEPELTVEQLRPRLR